jgi:choline-sulfatase
MDDEHRADVLGYAGDDVVRTPTLDRLADEGVVFENAYTPAPRCVPARQCLAAGQLPDSCGCRRYGDDLPPRTRTFARQFTEHGYHTVAAGKLHHPGWDKLQGWRKHVGPQVPVDDRYVDEQEPGALDTGPVTERSQVDEIRRAGVGRGRNRSMDDLTVRAAEHELLEAFSSPMWDRGDRDRPTMLMVSLEQPHYPYYTTQERFEYYLNRVDPYVESCESDHPLLTQRAVDPGVDVTPREIRRATAAYYGMVETVDEAFGRVIDELTRHGQDLDDWIVVFASDHGEMLGEHGVWEKGHFYDASARVPLVVRYPERFDPGTVDANVNLCDLYATLCDLCEIPVPEGIDSRSLVGLAAAEPGARADWPDETVSAEDRRLMIKRGDLKYVHCGAGEWFDAAPELLFDLSVDPDERRNVIDDPAYAEAVATFRRRRTELGYGPDATPGDGTPGYDARTATRAYDDVSS